MYYDEPPENYMQDPPYCEDCEHEECLLDDGKTCPKQEKWEEAYWAERQSNPCFQCKGKTGRDECKGCGGYDDYITPS